MKIEEIIVLPLYLIVTVFIYGFVLIGNIIILFDSIFNRKKIIDNIQKNKTR